MWAADVAADEAVAVARAVAVDLGVEAVVAEAGEAAFMPGGGAPFLEARERANQALPPPPPPDLAAAPPLLAVSFFSAMVALIDPMD